MPGFSSTFHTGCRTFAPSTSAPGPRFFLARLHRAETELAKLKGQATKAQQAAKQAAVTPAKAVGQRAGGYKPGLDDSLPADEWLRRRNAQLAKAGAR